MDEQIKPIIIHDEERGMDYTLEFNRDSVRLAEERGFSMQDLNARSMVRLPELFFYAFHMHHPTISRQRTDHILFDELGGMPEGMAERLGALYGVPYNALINETGKAKNSRMTVEF